MNRGLNAYGCECLGFLTGCECVGFLSVGTGRIFSPLEIVKREEEFERELKKQIVNARVLIAATKYLHKPKFSSCVTKCIYLWQVALCTHYRRA